MYEMIKLNYNYKDLKPYYSNDMFYYHYFVLYKGYTDNLNNLLLDLKKSREENNYSNIQSLEKKFSFNADAYILHSLFFENLIPMPNKTLLSTKLVDHIKKDFDSYDSFINMLNAASLNIEGPGWVVFGYDKYLEKLLIIQVENHKDLLLANFVPLLVIDMWEHSYYLDYKTDKKEYVRNLFYILDFNIVNKRYDSLLL